MSKPNLTLEEKRESEKLLGVSLDTSLTTRLTIIVLVVVAAVFGWVKLFHR